jgi:hypothetical protein
VNSVAGLLLLIREVHYSYPDETLHHPCFYQAKALAAYRLDVPWRRNARPGNEAMR